MIVLSRPSVSPYLARTLYELNEPVLLSDTAHVPMKESLNLVSKASLQKSPKTLYQSFILTSSENALSALNSLIPHDDRVMKSKIFKDKNAFRLALSKEFPNFYYKKLDQKSLKNIKLSEIPFPVVLKPAIGISSIGVVRVKSSSEWNRAVEYLYEDLKKYQKNYESNVVDSTEFIIEKYIEGPELAIDGYFNSNAEPVILNILEHLFKNADDTSDRIYYTRRSLLKKYLKPVQEFLIRFGDVFDLKRFPFHLELRQDPKMGLIPIELNPLRFSGLGTCELAEYAYGLNVYRYFFKEQKPDWDSILSRKDDSVYSFMCADLPDAFFRKKGLRIQDREFMKEFKEVLDYRMLDEEETSTFAVIFFRDQDHADNKKFLNMNFERFLKLSNPRKGKS